MNLDSFVVFFTSFLVVALSAPFIIPMLRRLKFGQSVRSYGPKSHLAKNGTPTMGGIMMVLGIVISLLMWEDINISIAVALFLTVSHGLIGFLDDYIKIVMKRSLGLKAYQKLVLQFLVASVYLLYMTNEYGMDTSIFIPGTNIFFDLGWFYYVFAFLLLLGTTNAVNLTDGLDGLASSVTIPVMLAYMFIASLVGNQSLISFSFSIIGACIGFLIYNKYPAKVFMGDTGSLAIGGAVAAVALLTKTELLLVIIGGVYVLEALSVILQVSSFKLRKGKKIFLMTPIHHHFELMGWNETKIVFCFSLVSLFLSLLGGALYYLSSI